MGLDVIVDSVGKDCDLKRHSTAALHVPMMPIRDPDDATRYLNLHPVHCIFANKFCPGEDFTGAGEEEGSLEREAWDPRVTVSMQEKAWMDGKTNTYAIKMTKDMHDDLVKHGFTTGMLIEDNLGSHSTPIVIKAWDEYLPNWVKKLYPKGLTWGLQVVDRHIGIQYKRAVYIGLRKEMMKNIRALKAGELPPAFTARQKRILITKILADKHEELAATDTFFNAFIRTGTWLPLDGSMDHLVKIQGLPEYDYRLVITPERVRAHIESLRIEADKQTAVDAAARTQLAVVEAARAQVLAEANRQCLASAAKGVQLLPHCMATFVAKVARLCDKLALHLKKDFIIAGSFITTCLAQSLNTDCDRHVPELIFNDVDVYHGVFDERPFDHFAYEKLDMGFSKEINLIQCTGLNLDRLVGAADINVVAGGLHVHVSPGGLTTKYDPRISPLLWQFLLVDLTLRCVSTTTQTHIRAAYKSMQLSLPLEPPDNDPLEGEFFKSHVEKLESMQGWPGNPFKQFKWDSVGSAFKFQKITTHVQCATCGRRGAVSCKNRMCKACCTKQLSACPTHKVVFRQL